MRKTVNFLETPSVFEYLKENVQLLKMALKTREIYTYPEGDLYEGEWSEEGKKHGVGVLKLHDGTTYEGRFMHGVFSGYGKLVFADGTIYKGEFADGVMNGFGVYRRIDRLTYEGAFRGGRPEGPGMITFPDGSNGEPRQEGFWEGTRLVRRVKVKEALEKARLCAQRAVEQAALLK